MTSRRCWPEKTLRAVSAHHLDAGLPLKGYEIHHGRTEGPGLKPLIEREDGEVIGLRTGDGLIWGTYLHGIFDADGFRRWFIDGLRMRKGLPPKGAVLRPTIWSPPSTALPPRFARA